MQREALSLVILLAHFVSNVGSADEDDTKKKIVLTAGVPAILITSIGGGALIAKKILESNERVLKKVFSQYKISESDNNKYYQMAKDALNAKTVEDAEFYYLALIENNKIEPELKENVLSALKNAKSQIKDKDGKTISHAEIQHSVQEYLKNRKTLKEISSRYDMNNQGNQDYHGSTIGILNDTNQKETIYYHRRLVENDKADPSFKEEVNNFLKNVQSKERNTNGRTVSHEEVQQNLKKRHEYIKVINQAFSQQDRGKSENIIYQSQIHDAMRATSIKDAVFYHKQLMQNKDVDPAVKERVSSALKNVQSHVRDERGQIVSHAHIQERARAELYRKRPSKTEEISGIGE